ncbi:MAG: hypothetical protein AAFO94_17890 [Bacteroidota bacterium]
MEYKDPKYKQPKEQLKSLLDQSADASQSEKQKGHWVDIHCPRCAASVGADGISLDRGMAKCGSCHAVFSVEEKLAELKQSPKELAEVAKRMEVVRLGNAHEINVKPLFAEGYKALTIVYGILAAVLFFIWVTLMFVSSLNPLQLVLATLGL